MGLANCDLRGVWRKKKRERERSGGGCAWRGAYVIHYFHCRKWKAVSGMGPAGRAMGASTGKKELGWGEERREGGERERGDSVTHSVVSVCKLSRQRDHSAAPRWISAREIWCPPGSLWIEPDIPAFPRILLCPHLYSGSLSTALCLPFRSGARRRSSRLLQKRKLTKDKPLPSVSPIYIPELDFPSSRLWDFARPPSPPEHTHSLTPLPPLRAHLPNSRHFEHSAVALIAVKPASEFDVAAMSQNAERYIFCNPRYSVFCPVTEDIKWIDIEVNILHKIASGCNIFAWQGMLIFWVSFNFILLLKDLV